MEPVSSNNKHGWLYNAIVVSQEGTTNLLSKVLQLIERVLLGHRVWRLIVAPLWQAFFGLNELNSLNNHTEDDLPDRSDNK